MGSNLDDVADASKEGLDLIQVEVIKYVQHPERDSISINWHGFMRDVV
jgi:hypothetical protein